MERFRVSSNQKHFSVRTEKNLNSICFDCFPVCFMKPKTKFRFLSVFRTCIETNMQRKSLVGHILLGAPQILVHRHARPGLAQ